VKRVYRGGKLASNASRSPRKFGATEKWDAYEAALCDMADRTSTEIAP
jgi:polyphosphate kinase 2 (PPK2 family)